MRSGLQFTFLFSSGYFALAAITIAFTRFGDGFAALWFATPCLTAALAVRSRKSWLPLCAACAIASILATGWLGLGWSAAIPLALVNILEGALAAHLIRRRVAATTMDSLAWFGSFFLRIGVIPPAVGATLGTLTVLLIAGSNVISDWSAWFIGHALGGLTFTPIALLVARGELRRWLLALRGGRWAEPSLLLGLFVGATVITFVQARWPLLFFPLGPLMLICFRQDRVMAALAVALLGIIGGVLTASGHGPISPASDNTRLSLQFFQFYLASVVITILPVTADLRSRRRLMRELRQSDERFRILLENSTDVLLHLKPDGTILYASPSVERQTGINATSLIRSNAVQLVDEEWRDDVRRRHTEVLAAGGETVRYEYMAGTVDGSVRWFETISRAICNAEGSVESVINVVRDIDARKTEEFSLVREASCDALTGLSNRRAFVRTFEDLYGTAPLSIAMVDIDHFKLINDRFGHAAGDCALQTFAEVARRVVRKNDLIARLGGEEFAILFRGMTALQCWNVCERLRVELSDAVTFYGSQAIQFTVSVGVTDVLSPDLPYSLQRADEALYAAKRDGRDRLRLAA